MKDYTIPQRQTGKMLLFAAVMDGGLKLSSESACERHAVLEIHNRAFISEEWRAFLPCSAHVCCWKSSIIPP